ncbi:IS630 family transposase [Streptomyces sp. NPDC051664]|uniref:IS630 family transposase n=1 Tax=Streptomyces sp. NPDC051664 TaxID=3365668 RepID=UPI0037BACD4F
MARMGRPKAELTLSDEERAALEGWVRRRSTPQAWALRCRIILACAEGASNKDVAAQLGSTPQAVGRWRSRFVQHRIAGLGDMPRPGGPRTVTDEQVAAVVTRTLESTPKNATHWSTRSMAKEMGLSQSSVSRIWRAFGLQPHRSETFKLSTDPYFVDKVHDVVGLYLDPPERALVFCVDEKSQIQALDRSQPVLPMMPGVPERATRDYVHAGTTTLFAALEVATGKVIGSLHRRHRAEEFKKPSRTARQTYRSPTRCHVSDVGAGRRPSDRREDMTLAAPQTVLKHASFGVFKAVHHAALLGPVKCCQATCVSSA